LYKHPRLRSWMP